MFLFFYIVKVKLKQFLEQLLCVCAYACAHVPLPRVLTLFQLHGGLLSPGEELGVCGSQKVNDVL